MKYTIFDTIIHILCIGSLSPKRSPLVQSGERSHHANIITGDIITVITPRIALIACIASLSHLDSASEVFVEVHVGFEGVLTEGSVPTHQIQEVIDPAFVMF